MMTVEIAGVRGYEYQYLVSAYVALKLLDQENVGIYIECADGEDSRITFQAAGEPYILDVQVKDRSAQIDLAEFSSWISHFDKYSGEMNLLEKLKQDANRFVLFITNARCQDDVSLFVDSNEVYLPLTAGMGNDLLDRVKTNVLAHYTDATPAGQGRRRFLQQFFRDNSKNQLRKILKKNRVWESMDWDTVYERLARLLNRKYAVPQSKTDDVISKLDELVRQGRDSGQSIMEDVVRLLAAYNGNRIFPYDEKLVPRAEMSLCSEVLEASHVLLLTGVSFCGKTYLAKEIAQRYQESGFRVKITSELDGDSGALAFLRHVSHEERLLVLEDPFGSMTAHAQRAELIAKVERLLDACGPYRKLIVTTRSDILLHALRRDTIAECHMKAHIWHDLTSNEVATGEKIWSRYYGESDPSKVLFKRLQDWLERYERTSVLQPGQIVHLYYAQPDLGVLEQWDESAIVNEARIDSNRLARQIDEQGQYSKHVFIALGLSCNTYRAVKLDDLAFLLSESTEEPALNSQYDEPVSYHIGGKVAETPPYPAYQAAYEITGDDRAALRDLRDRGYIKVDSFYKTIVFTHPIYYHASKILFQTNLEDVFADKDSNFRLLGRSLASPSKDGNLCALMMAEWQYAETQDATLKQRIKVLLLRSLHSLFPSVKDRVIMYFNSRLDELNDQEQKAFVRAVKIQNSMNDDDILWHKGEPYFNTATERRSSFDWLDWDEDRHAASLQKLAASELLTAEEIRDMLAVRVADKMEPADLLHVIRLALAYDESFIRAKAVKLLFQQFAYTFEDIAGYLEPQEHPDYIYKLFRGALSSWSSYKPQAKSAILDYVRKSLSIMSVALRSKRFLEYFEDQYARDGLDWDKLTDEEARELWLVWYDVFIALLNHFPSQYIRMNEAHMVKAARESLAHVDDLERIVQLASSWHRWLHHYSEHHLPEDYGMNVADYLLKGTGQAADVRAELFQELLSVRQTSLLTVTIGTLVDHWPSLSIGERAELIAVLQAKREDVRWLRGVALNRRIVPDEVQIAIVGEVLFGQEIGAVVDRLMAEGLLECCLNVHCGYPQPLWWNGYHHHNEKVWNRVIVEVLGRPPEGRCFDIALREFIDALYYKDTDRFQDGMAVYTRLVANLAQRQKLFRQLLTVTATNNQSNKQMWDLLLAHSSEEERQQFFTLIAENIEAVQYQCDDRKDLLELFERDVVFGQLCSRLSIDHKVVDICFQYMNYAEQQATTSLADDEKHGQQLDNFKTFISLVYEHNPPRMTLTNRIVGKTLRKLRIADDEIDRLLEANRHQLIESGSEQARSFEDHYELEHWVL
ncbi:ATP-binding protein [Paenibacillus donghaensis]|uniref:AAA+ ATPase domain-containing protein n=1 Tax=Paenibacillus donghaensis TaxID=414771 RepID=A0A2Z2KLH1_9BACL|nr:ATP-binding protein [Paenibacillus donghaensis]ASA24290.1 hypothetical protein B9T62_28120 [Paenibacillus donghaensis]